MLKVNSQAQSLLMNNKDLKPKNGGAPTQDKGQGSQTSKVDELKQMVQKGEYRVDINKTAQAMLNEFVR